MAGFIIRHAAILTIFLSAGISLIRAQPYDDGGLSALLIEQCAPPCWRGIQPGITTGSEALALVEQLQYTRDLGSNLGAFFGQIYWRWPQDAGFKLNPDTHELAYVWLEKDVVRKVFLPGFRAFGDVSLVMGRPERVAIYTDSTFNASYAVYLAIYPGDFYLASLLACDANTHDLWNAQANVHIGARPDYVSAQAREYSAAELRGWMPARLCRRRS
ncbi:MAG TPA: hypothetical protein VKY59_21915 [Spirillospora sp.]|nr:hypothetical protein [Spirillospora sp.]